MSQTQLSDAQIPPMVYLPCIRPLTDQHDVELQFRQMRDGRTALLAYTALDRLVHCCGPDQPWVLIRTANLDEVDQYERYDVIFLDIRAPEKSLTGLGMRWGDG